METVAEARPPDGEVPEGPKPRDLRKELAQALRKCTGAQRIWLRAIPDHKFQVWGAATALKISHRSIQKWLRDPAVKLVREIQDEIATEDLDLTQRRVLTEYARIAFADVRDLFNDDGTLKHPSEWPDDIAAAVEGIDTQERRLKDEKGNTFNEWELVRKIKTHSKLAALEFLATYKKMAGAKRISLENPDGSPLPQVAPVIHFVRRGDTD